MALWYCGQIVVPCMYLRTLFMINGGDSHAELSTMRVFTLPYASSHKQESVSAAFELSYFHESSYCTWDAIVQKVEISVYSCTVGRILEL